jgi:hypothetical protein
MLNPIIYHLLLVAVAAYAFLRGRADERLAAVICVVATIATRLVLAPLSSRYSGIEFGVFLVDLLALAGFTAIALRTDRFWPMWVAGLQLTTTVAHLLKGIQLELVPHAYAAAARFWVYPIFLIIVIGTWRSHRRRLQEAKATVA